ncbi:MAG: preprotein translocase subunit SecA [Francisellaceae bacterium]|jgi:preprotein translocase subunit SecA
MVARAVIKKVFGSRNDRLIKSLNKKAIQIGLLESGMEKLSDEQLKDKTKEFRQRIADGTTLDKLLVEAFAVVRESGRRCLEMRHYDVQLIGGMILHMGKISEMRTGEGKTLVATLALYLNALSGDGAHLVTVNDYLARRDAEQMGILYEFLGLTTGVIVADLSPEQRMEAYACDITYGTNNEFGFDYLRDNMAFSKEEQVQRRRNFAVVDEVDSILIDEARTPLIISGAAEDSSELYALFNQLIPSLVKREEEEGSGDFYLDEKSKQAFLTENGHEKIEQMLVKKGELKEGDNLYSPQHVLKMHYLSASLRAHTLFYKDVDYMIIDNEVVIVDEHTGRAMPGRRWSDGLHQALEAKENVNIQNENQTLASVTFQNFFKLYDKLSGMTGTADTEAFEFHEIYDLEVVVTPTNKPPLRKDFPDLVFLNKAEKYAALIVDIKERTSKNQPVLVGAANIDTSEIISGLLKKAKINHNVLNAKQNEKEAHVIAEAGRPGVITIATNMAGRGTDIILGGNWQAEVAAIEGASGEQIKTIRAEWQRRHQLVIEAGGLCILGSERHDSRRIDNQLRGRSGRQGDPGESRFYLSLEDSLVRIFAPERMTNMLKKLGMGNGEAIESGMVSRAIAKAQAKVEAHHFDIRKNLLEYDNVSSEQRLVIYDQRESLLEAKDVSDVLQNMRSDVAEKLFHLYIPHQSIEEQWDVSGLEMALKHDFAIDVSFQEMLDQDDNLYEDTFKQKVVEEIVGEYDEKISSVEDDSIRQFERVIFLQTLDSHWREHINNMDHLRSSIHFRGMAQKDPKQEYKREAFALFSDMLEDFKYEVISSLSKVRLQSPEQTEVAEQEWRDSISDVHYDHDDVTSNSNPDLIENKKSDEDLKNSQPYVRAGSKVRRNDACGSGKKYKHCHGAIA